MSKPTLCHIFEAIGSYSAIAKVAMADVRIALDGGYDVTVVAKKLDESLRPHVQWLPLTVLPRGFFFQWTSARHFIKSALGNRTFDLIHGHQPQISSLCDVFQCHFLTRVAYEQKSLELRRNPRSRLVRLQQQGVLYAEDYYYRRWNPNTQMLFVSKLLQNAFVRLYGSPRMNAVLPNACPPLRIRNAQQRSEARAKILGRDRPGIVVGYIGGLHERKGYRRILHALQDSPDIFLLMGGQDTQNFVHPPLRNRMKTVGLVGDTSTFYSACDVFIVPSYFDPCPLVVLEASAVGTPVIATEGVGNVDDLTTHGAGEKWIDGQPLGPLIRHMAANRELYLPGIEKMASALSQASYAAQLLTTYTDILQRKATFPATGGSSEPIALAAK